MKSVQLTAQEAREFWPVAMPFLQKVLDKTEEDEYDVEHILERVEEETLALFLMLDTTGKVTGAYTIAVNVLPKMRFATIVHCGADNLEDVVACYPRMESYALANGAKKINLIGRKGWKKVVEPLGFKERLTTYEKKL